MSEMGQTEPSHPSTSNSDMRCEAEIELFGGYQRSA